MVPLIEEIDVCGRAISCNTLIFKVNKDLFDKNQYEMTKN